MSNEIKLTSLDSNQIPRYSYSEANRAIRVEVVNGQTNFQAPVEKNETRLETIEIPVIVRELEVKVIEVEKVITVIEYKTIEVPVIVPKIEYIEKPIYIKEFERVEIPTVVTEKEIVYIDRVNFKMLLIAQGITLVLILLSKFIH